MDEKRKLLQQLVWKIRTRVRCKNGGNDLFRVWRTNRRESQIKPGEVENREKFMTECIQMKIHN